MHDAAEPPPDRTQTQHGQAYLRHGWYVDVDGCALHEDVDDVPQDGLCGQQHHHTEDEGADGVSNVPAGVILVVPDERTSDGHTNALQDVANHMQHSTAQVDAACVTMGVAMAMVMVVCMAVVVAACRPAGRLCCSSAAHHSRGWQLAAYFNLVAAFA